MQLAITFLAGCLNKQRDLPEECHYHELLKKALSEKYFMSLDFRFATYHAYRQLPEIVSHQTTGKQTDVLVVLVRPFPFFILNKPVIKFEDASRKKIRAFHPALFFRRRTVWPGKYYVNIRESLSPPANSRQKFGLQDLNFIAGILLGLHKWASSFVIHQLKNVITLCHEKKIELIFLSMPKNHSSLLGNRLCSIMNRKLISEFSKNGVRYLDIHTETDKSGNPVLLEDGIHFSEKGHQFLKEKLMTPVCSIIHEKFGV